MCNTVLKYYMCHVACVITLVVCSPLPTYHLPCANNFVSCDCARAAKLNSSSELDQILFACRKPMRFYRKYNVLFLSKCFIFIMFYDFYDYFIFCDLWL